jgi:phosphatidate cytidylyltransferase
VTNARLVFISRLASSLILWSVALWIIFSGYEAGFFGLIAVVGMVGLWEFYGILDQRSLPNFKWTAMACGAALLAGSFYYFRKLGAASSYDWELSVLLAFVLVIFARQMFQRTRDISPLDTMAYTLFGLVYVVWLFNFITKIVYVFPPGQGTAHFYVLYLIVVTKFSDMGAYIVGSIIGKNPLVPHISPKKTWEGFFGALGFSLLGSFSMHALLPQKLGAFDRIDLAVLGLLLGFAAVIGDLAESIIKRSAGVKDSGRFLPGIGGALDLIDSLLFTGPLLFFYMRLVLRVGETVVPQ